ncbi:MAG: DUF1697 domain-containing protein [Acidimicrobiales bacterium]
MNKGPSTYVAFLRGVNVGGHNKLPMADLRSFCEGLGLSDVKTFIQSGNVIFSSESVPRAPMLEMAIEERFAMRTNVILRTVRELERALTRNPFATADRASVHVGFLAENAPHTVVKALEHERFLPDQFEVVGAEVYLYLPSGVGQSKLPAYVVGQLKAPVTVRNLNTVSKVVELALR